MRGERIGHTVETQRIIVDTILHELKGYGAALPHDERVLYGRLLKRPLTKIGAISYANSMHAWALMLISILVEQERKIDELNARLADRRVQERELNHPLAQDTRKH